MKEFSRRTFLTSLVCTGSLLTCMGPSLAKGRETSRTFFGRQLYLDRNHRWGKEKATYLDRLSSKTAPDTFNLRHYSQLPTSLQIMQINTDINQTPYVSDQTRYGRSDIWTEPADFVQNGGDCEDYALAKYNLLAQLGFPSENMFLLGVMQKNSTQAHACLGIDRTDGSFLILDNTVDHPIQDQEYAKKYHLVYAVNKHGLWRPIL